MKSAARSEKREERREKKSAAAREEGREQREKRQEGRDQRDWKRDGWPDAKFEVRSAMVRERQMMTNSLALTLTHTGTLM